MSHVVSSSGDQLGSAAVGRDETIFDRMVILGKLVETCQTHPNNLSKGLIETGPFPQLNTTPDNPAGLIALHDLYDDLGHGAHTGDSIQCQDTDID